MGTTRAEEVTEEVDLRELWPNKARDFTPWLSENLGLLGEKLGMELELVSREEPVGPFSLDILVKDVNSGALVAIENQLEWSDHSHLGQLLTYAAEFDASAAIWVAYGFNNEHGEVINWLNKLSGGVIGFYGVEVVATKTEGSAPSGDSRVVASPRNEWVNRDGQSGLSARAEKLRGFFQSLRRELWRTEFSDEIPVGRNYYRNGIQSFASIFDKDIKYGASLEWDSDAWASLYVGIAGAEKTNRIFDALEREKEEIKANFAANNVELQWKRDDGTGYSGVHVWTECSIDDPPEKLEEIRAWMIKNLLKFKAVLEPRLKIILSEIPGDDRG